MEKPPTFSWDIALCQQQSPTSQIYALPRLVLQFHSLLLSIRSTDAASVHLHCRVDPFEVIIKAERPFTK